MKIPTLFLCIPLHLFIIIATQAQEPQIPDNVDDFLYGLRAASMPEEFLQDPTYTQLLINYLITLPHTKDNPIFAAAKLATPEAARWLKDYLHDAAHMQTAEQELIIACRNNDLTVIDMLLQAGVNSNAVVKGHCNDTTPLFAAIEKNNNKALEKLLQAGARNFDYPKDLFYGRSHPLITAACQDNLEALELMLKAGADPDRKEGVEILDHAKNKIIMNDFLLRHGYEDLYEIDHSQDGTAVGHWALGARYTPETKKSIIKMVQNSYDIDGLLAGIHRDIYEICTTAPAKLAWLIEQLARSAHAKNNLIFAAAKIGNALGYAPYQIKTGVAEWLAEYVKDPQHMMLAEQELIIACGNNDATVIEALLSAGVTPYARGKRGLTALDNARARQAHKAMQLLVLYGSMS